ncbi:MAG TPA: cysteine--tRNA ligase, partial [Methylocella sp.]
MTTIFHEDAKALGCLAPTHEPRATDNIFEMIALINKLIAKGHAYVADGHVLFDVPSVPTYGKLSKRPLDEMIAGARVEVAPYKRGPMDFVLWKPSNHGEPGWESPWGRGRPGWHLECSAMSWKYLGEVFDIHGGGIDLVFPHHENEIAQTCSAFGHDTMANVWMHNGHLQVEGEKMSKSLGNFATIRELLTTDKFGGRSWPGEVLRLAILKTHYRQPIDFTVKALEEAERTLNRWSAQVSPDNAYGSSIKDGSGYGDDFGPGDGSGFGQERLGMSEFFDAIRDDLNTPLAIAMMHRLHDPFELLDTADILGVDLRSFERGRRQLLEKNTDVSSIVGQIEDRIKARAAKNWSESDRIRDELAAMGITLKDNKDGTTTWEPKR